MDGSIIKTLLIPLILVITTVISGWAINQLPAIEQSRAKAILVIKLAVETLIFAVFVNSLEDIFKVLQNKDAEGSIKTLALLFILALLLFLGQIIYDLVQLFKRTSKLKEIVNSDNGKDEKILTSKNKLKRVISLFEQYSEDPVFRAINADLNQLITPEHRKRASEWVEMRAAHWINNLQIANYKNYGVTNENGSEFCDDLKRHLKLLQRNIEDGIGRTPRKSREKVNQSIGSPVPYRFALADIQTLMNHELEQDDKAREWLQEEGIQTIQRYMQRLIDSIDQ